MATTAGDPLPFPNLSFRSPWIFFPSRAYSPPASFQGIMPCFKSPSAIPQELHTFLMKLMRKFNFKGILFPLVCVFERNCMSVWSTPCSTVLMFYICVQAMLQHHEKQHKKKKNQKPTRELKRNSIFGRIHRRKKRPSESSTTFFSGLLLMLTQGSVFYLESFWWIK